MLLADIKEPNTVYQSCRACQEHAPHGCDDCRKDVLKSSDFCQDEPKKIYIGSGEDVPEWSFV